LEIRKLITKERAPLDLLLSADPSQTHIEDYLKRGDCYVAENEDEIIGVYVLLPTRPLTVELVNIAVVENWQGRGIGKQLVWNAIHTAKTNGYKTIEVGTGNSSTGQLALYQKCGFRIIGIDVNFFIRNYQDAIFENGIQCVDMVRLSQEL
jgi:ribosomal protein S18 acetylase RimI-like enzyme